MTINQEVQKLEPDSLIELFKLDGGIVGGETLYFHGMTQQGPIWWQGTQYDPWPLKAEGFARTSEKQPTPKLTVANLEGTISELCRLYGDMVGTVLTRIRTFAKFLDNDNFGKKNLLQYSEHFIDALWVTAGGLTVTSNTTTDPNGHSFADTLTAPAGASGLYQLRTVLPDTDYTFSVWVKRGTLPQAEYKIGVYDVTNTTWIAVDYVPVDLITVTEWTRVSYTFRTPVGCTSIRLYPYRNSNAPTGGTIHVYGAQLELGLFMTDYEQKEISGVNPTANPNEQFPPEVWYIERKSGEDNAQVEFELASAFDLNGIKLPRRQIIANYCSWKSMGGYRGEYCQYTGPAVAKADGTPTTDPALDDCGGKLSDCKLREWPDDILNFGGFPAAGLVRT